MLKRVLLLVAALGWSAMIVAAPPSREPANLDPHKQEVRAYVESGKYLEDIAAVAADAQAWIEARAAKRAPGERLAMVFDLDETLFFNWPHISAIGLGYYPTAWDEWVKSGQAPAIEPVREVYRAARRLGVEVILITGRRERERPGTEKNLRGIGCGVYAGLFFKPDESKDRTGVFKTAVRAKVETKGFVIIGNIGDQMSDLEGGHAEKTFKLPNPFYLSL